MKILAVYPAGASTLGTQSRRELRQGRKYSATALQSLLGLDGADVSALIELLRDPGGFFDGTAVGYILKTLPYDPLFVHLCGVGASSAVFRRGKPEWSPKQFRSASLPLKTRMRQHRGSRVRHCWHNWKQDRLMKQAERQMRTGPTVRSKRRR